MSLINGKSRTLYGSLNSNDNDDLISMGLHFPTRRSLICVFKTTDNSKTFPQSFHVLSLQNSTL